MTEAPHRAYEITIRVGADNWEKAARAIEFAAHHLIDHGPECKSCMGGPDSNHTIEIAHDPEMTHERYFEKVHQWLAERKAADRLLTEMPA